MDKKKAQNSRSGQYDASKISHLFLSNDPPSDSELIQLTALLYDVDAELTKLAAAGTATESDQDLRSLSSSLKSAMSPIRQLPNEIIHKIIILACLPANGRDRIWNILDTSQEPWTLSRVSKRWRQTALGEPRLWCSMILSEWRRGNKPDVPALTACLARSGQHPLAILHADVPGESLLLPHLLPASDQWEIFDLDLNSHNIRLLEQIKGRLSELRRLYLYVNRSSFEGLESVMDDNQRASFDSFEAAPKLQEVAVFFFRAGSTWMDPTKFTLPWHQLTSLKTDFFGFLDCCPQLTDCELRMSKLPPAENYPIKLLNLKNLTVHSTSVFDALLVPSLESLSLNCHFDYMHLLSFLDRSCCALKTLEIDLFPAGLLSATLTKLMKGCPSLLTVVVHKAPPSNSDMAYGMSTLFIPGWDLHMYYDFSVAYMKNACN